MRDLADSPQQASASAVVAELGAQLGDENAQVVRIVDVRRPMALWRDKLFLFLARNATPATEYFSIPGNRLVELGVHVAI